MSGQLTKYMEKEANKRFKEFPLLQSIILSYLQVRLFAAEH